MGSFIKLRKEETMKEFLAAVILGGLLSPIAANAQDVSRVRFYGPMQPISLSGATAVVYDDAGLPVLRGNAAYIAELAKAPALYVLEWDVSGERVRVTAPGQSGIWLDCAELVQMPIVCATQPSVSGSVLEVSPTGGTGTRSSTVPFKGAARVPLCPGDNRCPRP